MKNETFALPGIIALITIIIFQVSCTTKAENNAPATAEKAAPTHAELITRGQYLVVAGLCNDCHSPKKFGPHGMQLDSTRLLSGHPASELLPPIDKKALQPGYWVLFTPGITAAVGPWGISYAANLTPDSTTGIGAWSKETFVKTLRSGKHLGLENGRPIMPPMPWEMIRNMSDEDLEAVYTYLRELPAISNRVPTNVPPHEVSKL